MLDSSLTGQMLPGSERFQFHQQYAGQNQDRPQCRAAGKHFARHHIRRRPGKHRFRGKDQGRPGRTSPTLRPGLHRERQGRGQQTRDRQRDPDAR